MLDKPIDWIKLVYTEILNCELEKLKLQAVFLYGADYDKLKHLKFSQDMSKAKKDGFAKLDDLISLGFSDGKHHRKPKKKSTKK
nr:hypothetical protein 23 [Elusimicrobiota bacterium]